MIATESALARFRLMTTRYRFRFDFGDDSAMGRAVSLVQAFATMDFGASGGAVLSRLAVGGAAAIQKFHMSARFLLIKSLFTGMACAGKKRAIFWRSTFHIRYSADVSAWPEIEG